MNRKHAVLALVASAAVALTSFPMSRDHALAATAQAVPTPGTYYLALGDSLSVGYQPDTSASWTSGWVYQFRDKLATIHPIDLQDLAIRGECSDTLIAGGLAADCPTKQLNSPSQLQEAVTFLKDHPGMVNPITVDIGANDLGSNQTLFLGGTPAQQKAILASLFPRLAHNWGVIFGTLRAACPKCTIIALNQYSPFPAGVLKTDITPIFTTYTSLLKQAIHPYRVRFADVYTPFVGHELTYTWISRRDNHATTVGYTVMAEVVARASGYPIH
jgi:lysophospholipase L1-like esterase